MHSIMAMNIKGDSVGIFKKVWYWLFEKKEVEKWEEYKARRLKEGDALSKEVQGTKKEISKYATGGYIKNAERYVAPRYSETISSSNNTYRNNNDNFLTGAMVGYVVADSLNDNSSYRDVEETKPSNYESSYVSSSYGSGSYSSSSDSGSSSSCSCDSGC